MTFKHIKTGDKISSKKYYSLTEVEQQMYRPDYSVNVNADIVEEELDDSVMDMFGGVNEFKTIDDTDAD